jgi:hypothetical protein
LWKKGQFTRSCATKAGRHSSAIQAGHCRRQVGVKLLRGAHLLCSEDCSKTIGHGESNALLSGGCWQRSNNENMFCFYCAAVKTIGSTSSRPANMPAAAANRCPRGGGGRGRNLHAQPAAAARMTPSSTTHNTHITIMWFQTCDTGVHCSAAAAGARLLVPLPLAVSTCFGEGADKSETGLWYCVLQRFFVSVATSPFHTAMITGHSSAIKSIINCNRAGRSISTGRVHCRTPKKFF